MINPTTDSFHDPFASDTDESYRTIHQLWPANTQIHEDHAFGTLCLTSLIDDIFQIQYEDWRIQLNAQTSDIRFEAQGTQPKTYIIERISLPLLRILKGCVLIHASAVAFHNSATAFLAPSGVGKSTFIAGLLAHSDAQLIADDALPIVQPSNSAFVLPQSSQIAMRHDMFDAENFVSDIEFIETKRLLSIQSSKRLHSRIPLKNLVLLESAPTPQIAPVAFSEALPFILKQQFAFSNSPMEISRYQFRSIMALQNIPCFKMGISCRTKDEVLASCREFAQFAQT